MPDLSLFLVLFLADLDLLLDLLGAVVARHPGTVLEGEAGEVVGVPEQLEALVHNLVDNAWRHGGPDVSVAMVSWREEERVGVDVVDDGPGVSPGNQGRVFERFFTTDREAGGTGLGLALARAVCRAHGGSISLESRPGRTRFRVSLPVAQG